MVLMMKNRKATTRRPSTTYIAICPPYLSYHLPSAIWNCMYDGDYKNYKLKHIFNLIFIAPVQADMMTSSLGNNKNKMGGSPDKKNGS